MAYEDNNMQFIGLIASGDLSAYQYYVMRLGSAEGDVVLCNSTYQPLGVLQNEPEDNEAANIPRPGAIGKVYAGETITPGSFLVCDTNGRAIATTTSGATYFGFSLANASSTEVMPYLALMGIY